MLAMHDEHAEHDEHDELAEHNEDDEHNELAEPAEHAEHTAAMMAMHDEHAEHTCCFFHPLTRLHHWDVLHLFASQAAPRTLADAIPVRLPQRWHASRTCAP